MVKRYTMSTPRAEGNVTLMTVARAVGVSPTTVSNAYNRPHKLTPALRERILGAARDLGYPGPNPVARSLRRGRAGSIGLLFGEALTYAFQDPGAVEFLRGLAEGTARHNTVLQLIAALDVDEQEGASLLANAIIDGLVVWTLPERHPLLRLARERNIPLVIHGSPRLDGVPFVGIDDRAAAQAAAEHLLQLGHRSLTVISQPFGPSRRARHRDPAKIGRPSYRVTRERLAGYQAAASAAAPQPAALEVYEVAVNSRDEGHRARARTPARHPAPHRGARHERRTRHRRARRRPRARPTRPPRLVGRRLGRLAQRSYQRSCPHHGRPITARPRTHVRAASDHRHSR